MIFLYFYEIFYIKESKKMLNLIINIKPHFNNDENLIFVYEENFLNSIKLSENQKTYIKNQLDKDTKIIEINNYSHFIYIINRASSGKKNELEFYRTIGNDIVESLNKHKQSKVNIIDNSENKNNLLALTEGMVLGNYQFIKYFKDKDPITNSLREINIVSENISQNEIDSYLNILNSVYISRDLGNEPYSALNSLQLSEKITEIGEEAGFQVRVLNLKEIMDESMGGLLAVNKGSNVPATFSILEWNPENAYNYQPIILVGKGLVFDSGGYSIKPTKNSMDMMNLDMAGAAAVIGVFNALSLNRLPLHVIGLIPSTDNAVDSKSYVPGDVIKMHNGLYVEVLNTDAEGRLILADALSYAKKYKPELVIDLATLTGSAAAAIGSEASVIMGTADHSVFNKLELCGENVHERTVKFPFWDEYKDMLKSTIADIKNIGGSEAGAVTAGKFLEYFTDYPWIHIDVAGPAMIDKRKSYVTAGGTGYGVRLIYEFLKLISSEDKHSTI